MRSDKEFKEFLIVL